MPEGLKLTIIGGMMLCGGWLLLTARRRGQGTDPHCMSCGYNVSKLSSDRCPECGESLNQDTITIGPPSRFDWNRFLLGAVLLFVPAAWVVLDFAMVILRGPMAR